MNFLKILIIKKNESRRTKIASYLILLLFIMNTIWILFQDVSSDTSICSTIVVTCSYILTRLTAYKQNGD